MSETPQPPSATTSSESWQAQRTSDAPGALASESRCGLPAQPARAITVSIACDTARSFIRRQQSIRAGPRPAGAGRATEASVPPRDHRRTSGASGIDAPGGRGPDSRLHAPGRPAMTATRRRTPTMSALFLALLLAPLSRVAAQPATAGVPVTSTHFGDELNPTVVAAGVRVVP